MAQELGHGSWFLGGHAFIDMISPLAGTSYSLAFALRAYDTTQIHTLVCSFSSHYLSSLLFIQ